jgi:hypothetical protein
LIGVKTATVEKAPWSHTLRVLGRVTPDETRTYRMNAAVNGWIEEVLPVTTGSLVKKNDILATYYSLEYRNLVQNYFNLINITKAGSPGEKAVKQTSRYSTEQLRQLREASGPVIGQVMGLQIEYYREPLQLWDEPYQVERWSAPESFRLRRNPCRLGLHPLSECFRPALRRGPNSSGLPIFLV